MQLLLERNGAFSSKCSQEDRDNDVICPAQTSSLVQVQFIAQITQVASPLLGEIADRYGAPTVAYLMAMSVWLGLSLLIVSAYQRIDGLLYVSFVSTAFGTWTGGLLTVQTGMYFLDRTRSRVIFSLNSMFDAGSITYLGLWAIGEWTGASLTTLVSGYLGLAVVLFGGSTYFWTVAIPATKTIPKERETKNEENTEVDYSTSQKASGSIISIANSEGTPVHETESLETSKEDVKVETDDTSENDGTHDLDALPETNESNRLAEKEKKEYILVAERSIRQQISSGAFVSLCLFFGVHMAANQYNLTTMRVFLAYLGDDDVNNKYLTIFSFLMPVSLCALPAVDAIIYHLGFHGGFQTINILALGYSLIKITSENLNVQVFGFILFSFYRSFLFGVTMSFLPTIFAPQATGKVYGLLIMTAGFSAFLNIPLTKFAVEQRDGNFFIPNLIYTVAIAPCFVVAWFIGKIIQRENNAKNSSVIQNKDLHA
eukprot:CAMPEP_0198286602 /NCGR_PEP_ID=MMETSP1449-20131203/5652_1 /TAXON_ID=420275 /ORGANISM="Attheya septentrionalis, Strain CCMP2084" /LENGTH=485 /DNA_ID=CAMNT_0043984387 /DNA_START=397 /DNA_END=1854 /DNA_ORIENTATION=+